MQAFFNGSIREVGVRCETVRTQEKEVINICNCKRLGCVVDADIDICNGRVLAIIIPVPGKICGILGSDGDM